MSDRPYSGKLSREKCLQIGEKYDFRRENFRGLLALAMPMNATSQISRENFHNWPQNHEIREIFSSKVPRYTVIKSGMVN